MTDSRPQSAVGGITGGRFGGREKLMEGNCQEQSFQHLENPRSDLSCSPATWRQGVPPPTLPNVLVHTSHRHLPGGSLYQHLQFPCGAKLIRWLEPSAGQGTQILTMKLSGYGDGHTRLMLIPSHHALLFPHPQCPKQAV